MKDLPRLVSILVICMLMIVENLASAQDWPQWRGLNRDAKVTGFTAPETWPEQLTKKWQVNVGLGCSTPALVGDKLYVFVRQGAEEVVLCLNADNGDILWEGKEKYKAVVVEGGPSMGFTGPRSSPTVADGKLVTFGVGGILTCYDADNGDMLWRKDDFPGLWPQFYTAMSPLIADALCVTLVGGPDNGGIVAYDINTGEQKWKWTEDVPTYSSPVMMTVDDTNLVIASTERNIVALSLTDGKLCWQKSFPVADRGFNGPTPIINDQIIYYGGTGRGIHAVKISKEGDNFVEEELWSNMDNSIEYNTPVLKNDMLYGLSERGNFFCLNAQTGQTAWTDSTGGRGGYGSIIDAGSVLLALISEANLLVIEPNDKEYKELTSYKVADSQTYAHPVIAGNRIFVKDTESVILRTIE